MEKSSGSDWGESRQRRQRGMKLRWVFSPPCQEQPVFSPLWVMVFLQFWMSEWPYTAVSEREQTSESFEDVEESLCEASQLYASQESEQKFYKLLELRRVLVLSGVIQSKFERHRAFGSKTEEFWRVCCSWESVKLLEVFGFHVTLN